MSADKIRNEFIIRLFIATALMAAGLCYLGSLWDARMREQNLILIEPVVIIMIPFYLATLWFEYRRYRKEMEALSSRTTPVGETGGNANLQENAGRNQALFMGVAVLGVACFYILGAILATLIVITAGLLALGERRPMIIVITPLATTAVLWLVFIQIFGIRMPLFPWS